MYVTPTKSVPPKQVSILKELMACTGVFTVVRYALWYTSGYLRVPA